MSGVVIVDYGMGNLQSVYGALCFLEATPLVTSDPKVISHADCLILPGVGSFKRAMDKLDQSGLSDSLREAVLVRQRKILGICLGQQLMADYGDEDGGRNGLGFFEGKVSRIPFKSGLKVPHVGFNSVKFDPECQLSLGLNEKTDFYFVHSYWLTTRPKNGVVGEAVHGDKFIASYENQNVFSTQFHPEKSQTNGLLLLSNFLNI